MLPWWLVGLTPRDQSEPVLRIWNKATPLITAAPPAASVNAEWTVPLDKIAIVTGWSIQGYPAGTTFDLAAIGIYSSSGGATADLSLVQDPCGCPANALAVQTFFMVPPRKIIRVTGVFGAVAANGIQAGLCATLMPIGTVHLV